MKKIYFIAAAALALAACDKNDDNPAPSSSVAAQISASIGESTISRATNTVWAKGDQIGITLAVGETSRPHVNMLYTTTDGSEKFTGNAIYFYKPMVATAYYPFTGEEGKAPGIIEVNTDADNQASDKQPYIDFLWDQQETFTIQDGIPELHFEFKHTMSKVTLIFENGNDGTDVSNMVSYTIDGLVLDGTFDPETGTCAATDVAASPLEINVDDKVVSGTALSPLILIPQTPGSDKVKLNIVSNELDNEDLPQRYSCTLSFEDGELKPGKNYKYTIKVSKAIMSVEKSTIAPWEEEKFEPTAESTD